MINRRGFLRLAAALSSRYFLGGFPTRIDVFPPPDEEDEDGGPVDAQMIVQNDQPSMYLLGPDGTVWVSHNLWIDKEVIEWEQVCICPDQGHPVSALAVYDDFIYVGCEGLAALSRYSRATGEWEVIEWEVTFPG